MAKQKYVDSNGNVYDVSGTINNAGMLPIDALHPNDSTKDYIDSVVESGSNANGYYIKYKDGTLICTKKVVVSIAQGGWQAWGSCYETKNAIDFGNWAEPFIDTPTETVSSDGGAAWLEYLINYSATSAGGTRFVRPSDPGTIFQATLNIIGIGRWKA